MAVYNGEPYVAEAIESILGQTFSDFELHNRRWTVPATAQLASCCKYERSDCRIRFFQLEQNMGLAQARN